MSRGANWIVLLMLSASGCAPSEAAPLTCDAPSIVCGDHCVDVSSDVDHCGACDLECRGLETCEGGTCTCPMGTSSCSGLCVELGTADHCAGCDDRCADGMRLCTDGSCAACGAIGEPCCESGDCLEAAATCQGGTCVRCGARGEPCCAADHACEPGTSCTASNTCGDCGGPGQDCCAGNRCDRPVELTCDAGSGACFARTCSPLSFPADWSTAGRCSSETIACVNSAVVPATCLFADTTPPSVDGLDCQSCALYQWLQCSIAHGCASAASDLVCCMQAHCGDAEWPCSSCDTQNAALAGCNHADPSLCDHVYAGSAIGHCF